ncbi:hypothetical protein RB614_15100 [Phytohabitans sp. ZYX-F-186]|uniref:Uncharacterized protein n=1 Tax=Phytohabitans maris TaxID=3071409 RepID=A0ABU0ZHF4_9ACTN|nr:hypothetical protein [Phytohabitans sp. ZYX-F-186]MDQ7905844.1 hypothetical protein [Phytohabitans sp. ZYX-F-186]
MSTPDELERQHTLQTAVARYDTLRTRDTLAPPALAGDEPPAAVPLSKEEALEMLALGELIARKAGYGRQLGVRSARSAGASWSQIGAALGTTKQSAWEAHNRWLGEQDAEVARPWASTTEDERRATEHGGHSAGADDGPTLDADRVGA